MLEIDASGIGKETGDLTDTEDGVRLEWSLNASDGIEVGALLRSIVFLWRLRQVPNIRVAGENAATRLIGSTTTVRALTRPIVQLIRGVMKGVCPFLNGQYAWRL